MQILMNLSKFFIFALVSCVLMLTLNNSNNFNSADLLPFSIDTTNPTVTKASDTIWNDMGNQFVLDHQEQNAQVQEEIRKLLADQDRLNKILQAATPYIYFIYQQTQARGLPAEIALIPFIESEFNPNNTSNKGALGLWQLMSGTAHELGIKVKSGYDGRRNVIDSTSAALAYFKDLGADFNGNWYLAIAAYNCGQGKVESLERRTGSQNFWRLPLPKETKLYVPRLLAVAAIIKNPEKYGVQLPTVSDAPYFAEVKTQKSVNLATIAKSTGINIQELNKLNPDVKHDGVIQKNGSYTVLVPADKAPVVSKTIAAKTV
jgi:membrane-bound lytic murein transglycosylase D